MRRWIIVLCCSLGFLEAQAAPITFTGAELLSLPGASTPAANAFVSGTGARFNPDRDFAIVYQLPLANIAIDPLNFSVVVDYVFLNNDFGSFDQDFHIGLSDGVAFYNTNIFDSNGANVRPNIRREGLTSNGLQISLGITLDSGALFPAPLNTTAQYGFSIQTLATGTQIDGFIGTNTVSTFQPLNILNPANGFNLVFAGNNFQENYLIRSLTFTDLSTSVPEPGPLGGLALSLFALAIGLDRTWLQRRKKEKHGPS